MLKSVRLFKVKFPSQSNERGHRVLRSASTSLKEWHVQKLYHSQTATNSVELKEHPVSTKPVNKFIDRTHTCGELTSENQNQKVKLCGWLEFQRMGKFGILRDSYGSTQCIVDDKDSDTTEKLKKLPFETVLSIEGTVILRPEGQSNPKMKTGDIEVLVESIEIFNSTKPQLPFYIRNHNVAKEALQMQYRYLSLRFPEIQKNLRLRSWVTMKMREYLINKCGFVDVATPTLFRKTPGGAQEFIVPTQHIGKCYSLVQSPQQFKQLLMVGGIDKYFQIAQCYRDEGARNDRQPEFTQLDIEMSFVSREGVMNMVEELILNSWPDSLGAIKTPFHRITYEEAMENYGCDCPDLRIPGKISNVSKIIKETENKFDESCEFYATVFENKQQFLTKSVKEMLSKLSKQMSDDVKLIQMKVSGKDLAELQKLFTESTRTSLSNSLNVKENDVLFIIYGPKSDARRTLAKLRLEFTNFLESKGEKIRSPGYKFAWIVDFPLFEINKDTNILETTHHPFTHPHPDDMKHLFTNPLQVRGLQYDLVLNGSEVGGGSIRIHQKSLQEKVLNMLKIDPTEMYYLLEALGSGAPPHGGIALGLDRYISLLCGATSIRDVIAFPKTMEGKDLMSGAPTLISKEDKELYHISISNDSEKKENENK
ncbi:hypothetical protein TKK_0018396 [Trichogramma kaykai]|uniref:Aminoacyl-transfer RNA synthetases class-II family profile domain-containing protein n=1 Tax=Trichogramma kaykai TaxID=54128 RepID=A0ABD2VZ42_9HYME